MANRLSLIAALAAGLLAAPAMAQINQPIPQGPIGAPVGAPPIGAPYAYAGEPPAMGPMPGGMPREAWLNECVRRLGSNPAMAGNDISGTCLNWWNFYSAGGAPHPTYGYAIPVNTTETTEECPEKVVTRTITRRKIVRKVHHYHDKRVKIFRD